MQRCQLLIGSLKLSNKVAPKPLLCALRFLSPRDSYFIFAFRSHLFLLAHAPRKKRCCWDDRPHPATHAVSYLCFVLFR